jgi:ribose 5-phosphate isomerase B
MKVFIASDHAGFELKQFLLDNCQQIDFVDLGTDSQDSVDYPDYAHALSKAIKDDEAKGILLCGSGVGMSIAANRHSHIRAALVHNQEIAKLSKEHNNSNVLVLGARFIEPESAKEIIELWLKTDFAGDRHQRRVEKINKC